jgi:hypothetical protein
VVWSLLKTVIPLYSVVLPIVPICVRMSWYSWFAAPICEIDSVPPPASVASVTALVSKLVTCESAPSATCRNPAPSLALLDDCASAAEFAASPFAIDSPAGSSAPELIFEPEDSCVKTFCRLDCVLFRLFSA